MWNLSKGVLIFINSTNLLDQQYLISSILSLINILIMGKSEQKKTLKRPQEDDDSYEIENYPDEDEQIQDDGQQSSEHSSINLQQYLKNRDNIPSEPSDAPDDDEDQQDEDENYDDDEDDEQSQEKPKASKKQKLEEKKNQKSASSTNRKDESAEH